MKTQRKKVSTDVKRQVLHEAGYKCGNPVCKTILTIELHHLDYVSDGGENTPDNLLALCPTCHALHHQGNIPRESLLAWKTFLISLNEALGNKSIDLLLVIHKIRTLVVSGEGVLNCSTLIAANLVKIQREEYRIAKEEGFLFDHEVYGELYRLELTKKGKRLINAWRKGNSGQLLNEPLTNGST